MDQDHPTKPGDRGGHDGDTGGVRVVDRRWWARGETGADEGQAARLKPTYVEELEQRLADKDAELRQTIEKYREAAGEFEQARVRIRRDVLKDLERSKRAILADLLEVVDNLDRAIDAGRAAAGAPALLEGVELVRDQFLAKLAGHGVRHMEAAGQPFDPARHEALTTVPTSDPAGDGLIEAVITHGYLVGDEVLRPAAVAVRKLTPHATGD
jgi:molecular chaperone GrpE